MTFVLFILFAVCLCLLIIVASAEPRRSRFSPYELSRRIDASDTSVDVDHAREDAYPHLLSLQRVGQSAILVLLTLMSVTLFGWLLGIVVALALSLGYPRLASLHVTRKNVGILYAKYEQHIIRFVSSNASVIKWLGSVVLVSHQQHIDSRQELRMLVDDSRGILSGDEKKLITSSLDFDDRTVQEIMTPKSVVETIRNTEILGPLVLDDLHKTGHSRFPVIGEDIDHVVGILYVRDVLTLDTSKKQSSKVESAMDNRVFYIRQDHTLHQALSAFLSTHHHMFIVINEFRETVGIVTLEDTLEALLGRKIVDEFDAHDDMRLVATRNAAKKSAPNRSDTSKDV